MLMALLSACGLGPKAPLGVVDLPPGPLAKASAEPMALQLEVVEPEASALFDSRRIALRDPDGQLARLAGVALPDRAPRWLQHRALDALAAGPFAAVAAPGSGLKPDLRLILRLQRFELDYRGEPRGLIALHAVLVEAGSGRALASHRFEQAAPVEGRGSTAGAEALQRAAGALIASLADWAEARARAAAAPAPAAGQGPATRTEAQR